MQIIKLEDRNQDNKDTVQSANNTTDITNVTKQIIHLTINEVCIFVELEEHSCLDIFKAMTSVCQ